MAKNDEQEQLEPYTPGKEKQDLIDAVYNDIEVMSEIHDDSKEQFNDRTLKGFIDDGDKRLNSYVLTKEEQDKDSWQANVALPTVRDKLKRLIAGFSLKVPEIYATAFGEDDQMDLDKAEIAKWLIKGSYLQEENPILESFWESWECAARGTIVKYEGYLKTRYKQKFIKSYDIITGKVETEEKEVDVDDKCISFVVPLGEFLIKDFYCENIQDQPALAWIRYYNEDEFEFEFGKYADAEFVKTQKKLSNTNSQGFFYKRKWADRTKETQIEVVRYYNKYKDQYIILANGVLLLDAPLLWRVNGKKVYPFAKSIFEPFTGRHCFYGNSLPNVLMGEYDIQNTLFNSILDKEFRNLVPATLIGEINQEAFELEDEIISSSTKIYVPDVNQVKPMPNPPVSNADVSMIQMVARGIEESAPSLPSLLAGKKTTAREVVIAEEKLREIKSLYAEMLSDLWRQKYYLRLANIQLNYPQPRKIIDKDKKEKKVYRTYVIEDALLERETQERGYLAIQFRDIMPTQKKKIQREVDVEEKMMKDKGLSYKKMILPVDYLDNNLFQFEVIPESLYKTNRASEQSEITEKLGIVAKLFPQIFVLNQEEFFGQVAKAFDDKPEPYLKKVDEFKQMAQQQGEAEGTALPAGKPPKENAKTTNN